MATTCPVRLSRPFLTTAKPARRAAGRALGARQAAAALKNATFHVWGRTARGAGVHAAHGYDRWHVTVRSTTGGACRECEACTGLQKDAMATKKATCNPAYQCAGVRMHLTAVQLLKRGGTRARRHDVVHRCSDKVASCHAHMRIIAADQKGNTPPTPTVSPTSYLARTSRTVTAQCAISYTGHGSACITRRPRNEGGSGEADVAPSSHMSWLPAGDAIRAGCADVIPGDLC